MVPGNLRERSPDPLQERSRYISRSPKSRLILPDKKPVLGDRRDRYFTRAPITLHPLK